MGVLVPLTSLVLPSNTKMAFILLWTCCYERMQERSENNAVTLAVRLPSLPEIVVPVVEATMTVS